MRPVARIRPSALNDGQIVFSWESIPRPAACRCCTTGRRRARCGPRFGPLVVVDTILVAAGRRSGSPIGSPVWASQSRAVSTDPNETRRFSSTGNGACTLSRPACSILPIGRPVAVPTTALFCPRRPRRCGGRRRRTRPRPCVVADHGLPTAGSQTRTVPSSLADASRWPRG